MGHKEMASEEQRRIVAYLDGLYPDGHLRQAKVNALPAHAFGRLQSAPMLSILENAFKGEL
jgi:hypothetical protein